MYFIDSFPVTQSRGSLSRKPTTSCGAAVRTKPKARALRALGQRPPTVIEPRRGDSDRRPIGSDPRYGRSTAPKSTERLPKARKASPWAYPDPLLRSSFSELPPTEIHHIVTCHYFR